MKKHLLILSLLFFAFSGIIKAQTKHTYQFGYGKQFLEFKDPSHNFLLSYQRNYKSRVFWSIRSEFATEEEVRRVFAEDGVHLFQFGEGIFAYEDLIETDDINAGFVRLDAIDWHVNKFKIHPNIGYNFFSPDRTVGLNITTGGGVVYEKWQGAFSGISSFLNVVEEGYELEEPTMLIEGYKRGFDWFLHFGFQVYFNLKNDFQIGFDATIEAYEGFGGFPITHNFFVAKKI